MTNGMAAGFRPYGPGKFETALDALVYGLVGNGADEEAGEIETTGLYTLLVGSFNVDGPMADFTPEQAREMTRDERIFLARQVGVIVLETSDGFVSVFWYDSQADLQDAWLDVRNDIAALGNGAEPDDLWVEA
jgi:hypothetical protein